MLDVNKITSSLSLMPDQSLQQFAQMHKSDPYMLSLAVSESNRRKEMRAAAQTANVPHGQQPKVADKAIAEMRPAPEHVGIGALPASEMEYAGGGIVAFAEGGMPKEYPQGTAATLFPVGYNDYVAMRKRRAAQQGSQPADYGMAMPADMRSFSGVVNQPDPLDRYGVIPTTEVGLPNSPAPTFMSQQSSPPLTAWDYSINGKLPDQGAPQNSADVSPQRMAARINAGLGGGAGFSFKDTMEPKIRKLADTRTAQIAADNAAQEADYMANRPAPEDFKERRELLSEDTTARDTDQARGLAALTAAAAMVQSGKTTVQALVEGASLGGKQYGAAMKEIQAADKDRKKGLAELAEAQRAAVRGDFETAQARKDRADDRLSKWQDSSVALIASAYNTDHQTAYDLLKTKFVESQQNARTAATVKATLAKATDKMSSLKELRMGLQADLASVKEMPPSRARDAQLASIQRAIEENTRMQAQLLGVPYAKDSPGVAAPASANIDLSKWSVK